jgi:hypothetical protein
MADEATELRRMISWVRESVYGKDVLDSGQGPERVHCFLSRLNVFACLKRGKPDRGDRGAGVVTKIT